MKTTQMAGIIRQKEKGYFSIRVRAPAGIISSKDLQNLAAVADLYGRGYINFTTRLNPEIPWIHMENLDSAVQRLKKVGLLTGSTGATVRSVVSCKGSVCRHGLINTQKIAKDLEEKYGGESGPVKFKIGIAGCPNNCTKVQFNDLGFMAVCTPHLEPSLCEMCGACIGVCRESAISEKGDTVEIDFERCVSCGACVSACSFGAVTVETEGIAVFAGGRAGRQIKEGRKLGCLIDEQDVVECTGKILEYFRENTEGKKRFWDLVKRTGTDNLSLKTGICPENE